MQSCTQLGFMYAMEDEIDGETVNAMFDGIGVDLKFVISKIAAAVVFNDEFIDAGPLFFV